MRGILKHTKRPWYWRFLSWSGFEHANGSMDIVTGVLRPKFLFGSHYYVLMLVDHVAERNVIIPNEWIETPGALRWLLGHDSPLEIVQAMRTVNPKEVSDEV